jgi:hypothetical protein
MLNTSMTKKTTAQTKFAQAVLALVLGLLAGSLWAQQQGFSSLEERMTAKEFRNSGLEKLSEEELRALNDWIRGHSLGAEEGGQYAANDPANQEGDRRGFRDYYGQRTPITTRIKGTFNGWNGETVFELENGMIWKQAEQHKLGAKTRENPEVTIEPGFLSAWYLRIDGINKRLRVTRVE